MVRGGAAGAASPNVEIIQRSTAQYNINFGRFYILGRREKNRVKILAKAQKSGRSFREILPKKEPPGLFRAAPIFTLSQYLPAQSVKSSTGSTHSSKNSSRVRGVISVYFPKNAM